MVNSEFCYGSFKSNKLAATENSDESAWGGQFKPVKLSEKQKKRIRKLAEKAYKISEKKKLKEFNERIKSEKKAEKEASENNSISKVSRPIGVKLIGIISTIIIIALGGVTYLVSYFVSNDTRTNAEENNLTINSRTAADCDNRINGVVSSVGMFLDLLKNSGEGEAAAKSSANLFFDRNDEVIAVCLPATNRVFANSAFLNANEIESDVIETFVKDMEEDIEAARAGAFVLENASPYFDQPVLSILYPVVNGTADDCVCVVYSAEHLWESFAAGNINLSFLVNKDGVVLVSPDLEMMMEAVDYSEYPIVKTMLESSDTNLQSNFTDELGDEYIGAYRKLSQGNCGVVTVVKTSVILEGVNATTRRNVYLTVAILSFVIMIVWFFGKSMSVPLKQLTAVVNEINQGNFNTDLFEDLKTNGKDEIGVLINSTKNEREILNTFTKLTNKGVTRAIIRKEIDFDPHLKDITIFFSDIRGFTAISDGFKNRFGERSAAEIISFLNDYMSRMVTCITRTGGIVDKFEGDAIMACWGTLRQEPLDWEKLPDGAEGKAEAKEKHDEYVKEDALSAVKASLAMRYSLMKYNKDAAEFTKAHENDELAAYKPQIKIGRGLNTGRATVGFMGSFDKMEFTSIGDAVNFASRTEASNKPCGTDMLITEDTYNTLKYDYIKCPENRYFIREENLENEIIVEKIPVEFEVKGKGKQHFYGVVNMPAFDIQDFFGKDDPEFEVDKDCERCLGPKGPKTIAEVRALLGIETPDFGKVNLDEEENKIQVSSK